MSQYSEGNLSDFLPDVDNFIKESQLQDQIQIVMESETGYLAEETDFDFDYSNSLTQDVELQDNDYKLPVDNLLNTCNYSNNGDLIDYNNEVLIKYPPEDGPTLEIDEYSGHNDFEVLILPNGQKIPWEFSPKLNKIFITMNSQVPVAFSLKNRPFNTMLFVRATPVFSQPQHLTELVHRCVGHEHTNDSSNKGLPEHVHQHIIRCQNSKVKYCGNKDLGQRLSVLIPLGIPQSGSETVKEYYSFVCKNSCAPGGMSRRPIQVIFTLENQNGDVLGRRVIAVRVCSCPKRDKEKEEREVNTTKPPVGKKRKLDDDKKVATNDNRLFNVNFNIMGKENYKKVLELSRGLMANDILNNENMKNGESTAAYRKCYKEITTIINKIE